MLAKGKVSATYSDGLSVILPEYNNAVTDKLKIYGGSKAPNEYSINEFVIVAIFNKDFRDAIVLGK